MTNIEFLAKKYEISEQTIRSLVEDLNGIAYCMESTIDTFLDHLGFDEQLPEGAEEMFK